MLKKRLFGYSKRQVDKLLKQVEDDFNTEEEILLDKIRRLENRCELLKNENDADKKRLDAAKNDYSYFMKAVSNLLKRNSGSKE